jgi:hypothetical protein
MTTTAVREHPLILTGPQVRVLWSLLWELIRRDISRQAAWRALRNLKPAEPAP